MMMMMMEKMNLMMEEVREAKEDRIRMMEAWRKESERWKKERREEEARMEKMEKRMENLEEKTVGWLEERERWEKDGSEKGWGGGEIMEQCRRRLRRLEIKQDKRERQERRNNIIDKRNVSPFLRCILAADKKITENVVKHIEKFKFMRQLRIHYKALEISCHGLIWITLTLAFIWILDNKNLYQVQVNLLIGLLLDIVIIGVLKALTRRRRPAINNDPLALGPDKYSFPSGHASRAALVFYFFYYLWPLHEMFQASLIAWVFAVSISRLLMRRHYILDVILGLVIGYAEGILMSILYLEPETCKYLISCITDEKIDGAEYDV